ncbi:MAG TPA: hydrogenase maturation protease [Coriobacteriia bacterium]
MAETGRVVTLLGIGNVTMGDDGLGIEVVRLLEERARHLGVRVVADGLAHMGLMRHFRESDVIVVVDAIDAGTDAGAVFRFDPDEVGVTQLRSNNIHGMGVSYLLTNARLLGHDPKVIVYAVQVGDVRPSDDLTAEVASAAAEVEAMVLDELRSLVGADAEAG